MTAEISNPDNAGYISCPQCATLFKPKLNQKTNNNQIACICCGSLFEPTYENTAALKKHQTPDLVANTLKYQARVQNNIVDQLPIPAPITKNKKATDNYLKKYKFKSKLLLMTWIILPFIILAALINIILEYKDDLAQNAEWRDYIVQFCNTFDCQVPTYNAPEKLVIEDNTMVTANNQINKVQLLAMINNSAKFDQQFPNLKIKFTDINGKLIKDQIIKPDEYIQNYSNTNNLIAKNSKQYVSILINDPGIEAINYEISTMSSMNSSVS